MQPISNYSQQNEEDIIVSSNFIVPTQMMENTLIELNNFERERRCRLWKAVIMRRF